MNTNRERFRYDNHYICDKDTIGQCGIIPLAIATVPMQVWDNIYDETEALKVGTIFADLNLPFLGCGVRRT